VSSGKELNTAKCGDCVIRELVFAKGGSVLVSARSDWQVDWWETSTVRPSKNRKKTAGRARNGYSPARGRLSSLAPEGGGMRIFNGENNEKWFCPQQGKSSRWRQRRMGDPYRAIAPLNAIKSDEL